MEDKILKQMTEIAENYIELYKSDFTDFDVINYGRMYDKTPFIWIVRQYGTYLVGIASKIKDREEDYIEEVKNYSVSVTSYYAKERKCKKNRFFYIEKNHLIKELSPKEALDLVSA